MPTKTDACKVCGSTDHLSRQCPMKGQIVSQPQLAQPVCLPATSSNKVPKEETGNDDFLIHRPHSKVSRLAVDSRGSVNVAVRNLPLCIDKEGIECLLGDLLPHIVDVFFAHDDNTRAFTGLVVLQCLSRESAEVVTKRLQGATVVGVAIDVGPWVGKREREKYNITGQDPEHGTCFKCGERGHTSRECPLQEQFDKTLRPCYYCHQVGHESWQCPERMSMICTACGNKGHTMKKCPYKVFLGGIPEEVSDQQLLDKLKILSSSLKSCERGENKRDAFLTFSSSDDIRAFFISLSADSFILGRRLRAETTKESTLGPLCSRCGQEGHQGRDCTVTKSNFARIPPQANDTVKPPPPATSFVTTNSEGYKINNACKICGSTEHFARACPHRQVATSDRSAPPSFMGLSSAPKTDEGKRENGHERERVGTLAQQIVLPLTAPGGSAKTDGCKICGSTAHFARACPMKGKS